MAGYGMDGPYNKGTPPKKDLWSDATATPKTSTPLAPVKGPKPSQLPGAAPQAHAPQPAPQGPRPAAPQTAARPGGVTPAQTIQPEATPKAGGTPGGMFGGNFLGGIPGGDLPGMGGAPGGFQPTMPGAEVGPPNWFTGGPTEDFEKAMMEGGTGTQADPMVSGAEAGFFADLFAQKSPEAWSETDIQGAVDQYKYDAALKQQQLAEQLGGAGLGATGAYAGQMGDLTKAGALGAVGLEMDLKQQNKDMLMEQWKTATDALSKQIATETDAATKMALQQKKDEQDNYYKNEALKMEVDAGLDTKYENWQSDYFDAFQIEPNNEQVAYAQKVKNEILKMVELGMPATVAAGFMDEFLAYMMAPYMVDADNLSEAWSTWLTNLQGYYKENMAPGQGGE